MTVNRLQGCLMRDLEKVAQGAGLTGPDGGGKALKAYPQALPAIQSGIGWGEGEGSIGGEGPDGPESKLFPYAVVRVEDIQYQEGEGHARLYILFGIHNDGPDMAGYFELLNLIERTVGHYRTNPVLDAFWCDKEMDVAIQEDDSFPYFFGGIEMSWNLPLMEVEGGHYDE